MGERRQRDELMAVPDVLVELGGISRRTFGRWRELGLAPQAMKLPNGELRFWRSDVVAWLHAREETAA